jgi:integrase
MARVFKKSITRYLDADGRQVPKGTPGARKVREKSAKWYGRVPGSPRPVPLATNKVAAQQLLAEMTKKAELAKVGIFDPFEEHRKRPLAEHLEDFRRELEARDNAPRYVEVLVARLTALLDGCGFRFTSDLSASRAMDWLATLRRGGALPPLPAGRDSFTAREAAALLGVNLDSFRTALRRLRLARTGEGKPRRFPRAAVDAVRAKLNRGASVETSNQYLSHLKSFVRWMVKDRRIGENPFAHLEGGNVRLDRRHDRRELELGELRRLLGAARDSGQAFLGLTGWDRYHLYAAACGTGFRASAMASLTPESFDLDADPPTVTLAARENKSRKPKVQPLSPDLVELLHSYLADKPGGQPVWGGTWAEDRRAAEMLRLDLEAAGIPYEVEGPDGPLYADFHALRHTYLTLGARAGIDLRTLQELAGHSTPTLTARYSHRRLHDLAGAVEKLPRLLPDGPGAECLRATGTDASAAMDASCPPVAAPPDSACDRLRLVEAAEGGAEGRRAGRESRKTREIAANCDHVRAGEGGSGGAAGIRPDQMNKLADAYQVEPDILPEAK